MDDPLFERPRHSNGTVLAGALFIGLLIFLTAKSALFDMDKPTSYVVAGLLGVAGVAVPATLIYGHRRNLF